MWEAPTESRNPTPWGTRGNKDQTENHSTKCDTKKKTERTERKERGKEMGKTKNSLMRDLTHLYKAANQHKKFDIALKVKQLQAQIMGLLITKTRQIPKLDDLTDDEINEFLLANPC